MQQFEEIMGRIVGKALREQAENLGDAMGNHLCNKMLREVDELMVEQEQREEERYKKLDEAIRSTQKARQEIAVSKDGIFKKKSRFFRKNKRKGALNALFCLIKQSRSKTSPRGYSQNAATQKSQNQFFYAVKSFSCFLRTEKEDTANTMSSYNSSP